MLDRLRKIFESNGFILNVAVLVRGTAIGQVVVLMALPVLTRIYSPGDFGLLALYASILGMLTAICCLRFEIAIPLPSRDVEAINLLLLAIIANLVISSITAVIIALYSSPITRIIGMSEFQPYLWLVPIGSFATGMYASFQYWCTRQKEFSAISRTRIQRSILGVATQIGMGVGGGAPLGLILGQIVMQAGGAFALGKLAYSRAKDQIGNVSFKTLRGSAVRYKRFPLYSTFESLSNSAGMQLPVILIAGLVGSSEAGYLMVAMAVMAAPMTLIGTSISQVYLSHAPQNERDGRLGDFTVDIVGNLLKLGGPAIIGASWLAPIAFPLIFGEEWKRAGIIVAWMAPWFVLQFITSPVSMALHVKGKQLLALILQILGLIIRVGAIFIAVKAGGSHITEFYALSGFVFYLIYLSVVLYIVDIKAICIFTKIAPGALYTGLVLMVCLLFGRFFG